MWFEICSKYLYEKEPKDLDRALKDHIYLSKFIPLIKKTSLTITYNFDYYIERALFLEKSDTDTSLGYEVVTNPWTQFRRTDSVIYHPHGVLPKELMEFPQDRLIFSESSYARLFLHSLAGDFSFLLNHLSKNTCLIIGSSLEDEDLRNVLVQSAQSNPGNPHYYIYFLEPGASIPAEEMKAIEKANFEVYNLITLFLYEQEIAALAELLNCEHFNDNQFKDILLRKSNAINYNYYLTGVIGVGKSSNANQLRNLKVFDEWGEPRLPLLSKPWDTLNDNEKKECDSWVLKQFKGKNDKLRYSKFGINVIDRPPMDPLAFTPDIEKEIKAKNIKEILCPEGKWEIENGTIIFLIGNPLDLAARAISTGRGDYTKEKLEKMELSLREIYESEGVIIINTRGKSINQITKRISEIIHFEDYVPFSFSENLRRFIK